MKVSVIIPAYNEEKYIKKALLSVVDQKISADEIIVVDNNSSDKTKEIALKMGARVINEKIQGMIPTRNRGFNEAKFDIIARIDSDVIVPPNWIKRIKHNFETKKIDALSGPVILTDPRLKMIPESPLPGHLYMESLRLLTNGNRYLQGPNMSLTKNIWLKVRDLVNMDETKVHEDLDLSLKILKIGGIIDYDKKLIVKESARRMIEKPESFFVEYPVRIIKTFLANQD